MAATPYYYWLEASNASGNSEAVTANTTTTASVAPTNFEADVVSSSQIDLSWEAVTGATGYTVQFKVANGDYAANTPLDFGESDTSGEHTGLQASTAYTYQIRSEYPGVGVLSDWSNAVVEETEALPSNAPGTPTGLTITPVNSTGLTINWTAPSGATNITGYNLYGLQSETFGSKSADLVEFVTETSFTHSPLKPGNNWWYQVSAVNDANVEGGLTIEKAKRLPGGMPSKVSQPTATLNSPDGITVRWTKPDSGGSALKGYKIYSSVKEDDDFSHIGTTEADVLTYVDTTAPRGVGSYYKVSADAYAGEGERSFAVRGFRTGTKILSDKVGAPKNLSVSRRDNGWIDLSWLAPSKGENIVSGYRIEVHRGSGEWEVLLENSPGKKPTTYTHNNPVPGTEYTYRVAAYDDATPVLHGPYSNEATASIEGNEKPSQVRDLKATRDGTDIELDWDVPSSKGLSEITGYKT